MTAIPATFRAYVAEKVEAATARPRRARPPRLRRPSTCRRARSRSASSGRASTSRTASRPAPTARSPASARWSRASTWPARWSRRADPAFTVGTRGPRPRLRPRRRAPRRLRRVPARARPAGSSRCPPASRARRDGDRHGRLHRGDVRRRPRGARPDARRRPGARHRRPAASAATALAILAERGYEVWAATGKPDEARRLRDARRGRDPDPRRGDAPRAAARVGTLGRRRRHGRRGDPALRPAHAPDRRRPSRSGNASGPSSRRRSSRSSCAASRCSGWTRPTCRSSGAARIWDRLATDLRPRGLGEDCQRGHPRHAGRRARRDRRRRGARPLGRPGRRLRRCRPDQAATAARSPLEGRQSVARVTERGQLAAHLLQRPLDGLAQRLGRGSPGRGAPPRPPRGQLARRGRAARSSATRAKRCGQRTRRTPVPRGRRGRAPRPSPPTIATPAPRRRRPVHRVAVAEVRPVAALEQVAGEQDVRAGDRITMSLSVWPRPR